MNVRKKCYYSETELQLPRGHRHLTKPQGAEKRFCRYLSRTELHRALLPANMRRQLDFLSTASHSVMVAVGKLLGISGVVYVSDQR